MGWTFILPKEEIAARTIHNKIQLELPNYKATLTKKEMWSLLYINKLSFLSLLTAYSITTSYLEFLISFLLSRAL